jgi:catechol 2,3-dioxygenase
VVSSWYTDGSVVLDLDGRPVPVSAPEAREAERTGVVVGADGFAVATEAGAPHSIKLGNQL